MSIIKRGGFMDQLNKIENSSVQVNEMVTAILGDSLNEIDNYINLVRNCFINDKQLQDGDLDRIILQIPVYIYNLITLAQQLEMKKGLSKEHAKYAENEALLNAVGTVNDKKAIAENKTIQDRVTMNAYTTACTIVKSKIDGAMAILDSAKKVQQRRIAEMKLTGAAGSSVGAF